MAKKTDLGLKTSEQELLTQDQISSIEEQAEKIKSFTAQESRDYIWELVKSQAIKPYTSFLSIQEGIIIKSLCYFARQNKNGFDLPNCIDKKLGAEEVKDFLEVLNGNKVLLSFLYDVIRRYIVSYKKANLVGSEIVMSKIANDEYSWIKMPNEKYSVAAKNWTGYIRAILRGDDEGRMVVNYLALQYQDHKFQKAFAKFYLYAYEHIDELKKEYEQNKAEHYITQGDVFRIPYFRDMPLFAKVDLQRAIC